jgi:ribose transport system substrate-binding protein
MKRYPVVALVCVLLLISMVLPAAAPAQSPKIPADKQEYFFLAANVGHPFYAEGKAGWDAAAKLLKVGKADLLGPLNADVQQQVTMMEQLIANPNTAGILLYPVDYTAIGPVAQKARDKGIPVILGNGDAVDKDWRDAFVGTDNFALGRAAADLVAQALNGKGKVGISSFITAQNHQDRVKGFQDRVKEAYPDIQVLGVAPDEGTAESASKAARAFIQAHPDVNLMWTSHASSGAVANVIKELGLQGKILSVGTDRTTDQLDAIQDGTVSSTITQDTYSEEFISLMYLWLAYNNLTSLPDTTITKPLVITKDNIESQMKSPAERFAVGWPK